MEGEGKENSQLKFLSANLSLIFTNPENSNEKHIFFPNLPETCCILQVYT